MVLHHAFGRRGRSNTYSDTAIETALLLKGIFGLPLRALEGFISSVFKLMDVELKSPDYTCISKRSQTVKVACRQPSKGPGKSRKRIIYFGI